MQNFAFCTPTQVYFGKDEIKQLPQALKTLGQRILLVYGGGSIKKLGLYDVIKNLTKDFTVFELSGVEPNPKISSVRAGVKICKEEKIDAILAVGGGSVIDCCKNIACGAFYDGDPWDLVLDNSKVTDALPICSVLTLAATGSEFDHGCVISNAETDEKLFITNNALFPKISILDPTYTFSVSAYQTAAGSVDMISHICEQYFVRERSVLTEGICESVIRTVMHNAPIAIKEPQNYKARSELMWASSLACNGICSLGNSPSMWTCHAIEHEISAYTDITHGVGLAIITPHWMEYCLNKDETTAPYFAKFGYRLFDIAKTDNVKKDAQAAIDAFKAFLNSLPIPHTLTEAGVPDTHFKEMGEHACKYWDLGAAFVPVSADDVVTILKASL